MLTKTKTNVSDCCKFTKLPTLLTGALNSGEACRGQGGQSGPDVTSQVSSQCD
jgi:hypothetical protein